RGLADLAVERGDAGGVDDHAALALHRLLLHHPRRRHADRVEGPDEIDADHALELLERQRAVASYRAAGGGDARAVHEDMQAAEALNRALDCLGHLVAVRDICRRPERLPVAELVRGRLAGL